MLTEMQMSEVFNSELRIPPISSLKSLDIVVRELGLFPNSEERRRAMGMLDQAGFGGENRLNVGVKKLVGVIEMARQAEDPADKLTAALLGLL